MNVSKVQTHKKYHNSWKCKRICKQKILIQNINECTIKLCMNVNKSPNVLIFYWPKHDAIYAIQLQIFIKIGTNFEH